MTTSVQARQKIAEVVTKRSKVDQDLGAAEQKKATKEAEAADKASRAAKATSPANTRMYDRQADQARNAAIAEGKKIAALAKKRADLSKEEARHSKTLTEALKREAASDKRDADKAQRARQQEDRKREAQRKTDERARQQERIRAEQQRRAEQHATDTRISQTEERLTAQIDALRPPQQENLRILYATATPDGDLRVSQEIRRVKNAVVAALHRDLVDIEYAPDVTADDLLNYLTSFQPHVVHFSGHANEDVLVFDDGSLEGGQGRAIPIDLFMRAVTAPDHQPSLVVLNACESATNLEALLSGVPIAIGMAASVGDPDAITFATRFYRSIADGQTIESALAVARVDMEMNGLADHDLPTLVTAPGIDAATVRLVLPPTDQA
ncbi:CHAT domain-containing protein [Nocardioides aurantiacus]|uniref:CHAT domain-containing protein n=1 Tax=Nocardioides aurantiacus TaxID=86796 RepID=A0A3N2CU02_9ACTN|nr:CHAT domain-containing protein [Nocardioides aurantiacus]ROR90936.1 CHAT domain-containing protein [Nocardioides aurantiacus]